MSNSPLITTGLPIALAIIMMLLAASPGGNTATLFSHLFRITKWPKRTSTPEPLPVR
ncbi:MULTISPECIES: hypothetical protein [Nocardia]|uniref:hypothetical protein n=1 Tax=Nocardia TaxID=1817 RepID=UPI000ADF8AD3|nr:MULTISPECIES: hypothetical protein [Nocardia]